MSSKTSAGPKRVVNKTVSKILSNQKSVAQEKTPAAAGKLRKKPQPQPKAPAPAPALALAPMDGVFTCIPSCVLDEL